jgi:transcription elongation factor Elf1
MDCDECGASFHLDLARYIPCPICGSYKSVNIALLLKSAFSYGYCKGAENHCIEPEDIDEAFGDWLDFAKLPEYKEYV